MNQQQPAAYRKAVAQVSRNWPPFTFIPTMEAYYGAEKGDYSLVIMPFFITSVPVE